MFIDRRLQVSSAQALTATAASTDSIDLSTTRFVGPGEPLWFVIAVRVALGGTSPTFAASIQTDDNSAFSSPATLATSATLSGAAAMPAGKLIVIPMTYENERHLRLNYTLGGTSPTTTIDAWLTNQDPQTWLAQPDGI